MGWRVAALLKRAAIRRRNCRQHEAGLPTNEETWRVARPPHRTTAAARAQRSVGDDPLEPARVFGRAGVHLLNDEIVRIAFALDCHDREVIGWTATTAGISGEMIRDMMVHCVERRFGILPAPHRVQWLSDNGSIFAAYKTIDIARALNLEPCFTPVESPEGNGMAEAFVKTFKRDYVRVNPIPDAATALGPLDARLQQRPPALAAGLPFTKGVHQHATIPTRRVSGPIGSTPPIRSSGLARYACRSMPLSFAVSRQRVHGGGAPASGMGASGEIILAADGDTIERALGGIIVEGQVAVIKAPGQREPA